MIIKRLVPMFVGAGVMLLVYGCVLKPEVADATTPSISISPTSILTTTNYTTLTVTPSFPTNGEGSCILWKPDGHIYGVGTVWPGNTTRFYDGDTSNWSNYPQGEAGSPSTKSGFGISGNLAAGTYHITCWDRLPDLTWDGQTIYYSNMTSCVGNDDTFSGCDSQWSSDASYAALAVPVSG